MPAWISSTSRNAGKLTQLLLRLRLELGEGAPEVQCDLVAVKVDGRDHLLARHQGALVAEHVAEDLAALALPVGAQAAQILVHVVRVTEADRLHLDDLRHDVL